MRHWLVRHANAGDRHRWKGRDELRPVSKKGRSQAETLADRLASEPAERICSSPSVRCRQTVEPLAQRLGLAVEDDPDLAEGSGGKGLLHLVRSASRNTVACTHGDVLDDFLAALAREGVDVGAKPRCAKGSTWVLDVEDGRIVAARYLPPD
jgi:broad specificity phosphatase PhoE